VIGRSRTRRPVALNTALAIAAAVALEDGILTSIGGHQGKSRLVIAFGDRAFHLIAKAL
jgi:hypothetical protein